MKGSEDPATKPGIRGGKSVQNPVESLPRKIIQEGRIGGRCPGKQKLPIAARGVKEVPSASHPSALHTGGLKMRKRM